MNTETVLRVGATLVFLGCLTGLAVTLGASAPLLWAGGAVVCFGVAVVLWRRHFEQAESDRLAAKHRPDYPAPVDSDRPPAPVDSDRPQY